MIPENTQNAAVEKPRAPSLTGPEQDWDVDKHYQELYRREMNPAVSRIADAVNNLMVETYFKVFWDSERPKMLEEFLLPLLKEKEDDSTGGPEGGRGRKKKDTILQRIRFLEKCSPETQNKAEEMARKAVKLSGGRLSRGQKLKEQDYIKIDDGLLDELMREEFARADATRVRAYFGGMDLAACCKVNRISISTKAKDIYKALHARGLIQDVKDGAEGWSKLCKEASELRNTYAHGGPEGPRKIQENGGPEKALKPWFDIVKNLHSEELNQAAYEAVLAAWEQAKQLHNSQAFFFRDLLRDLDLPGADESDLRNAADFRGIPCDAACALYHKGREELADLLEREVKAQTKIPLERLRERFGMDIGDLEAYVTGLGVRVRDGVVMGRTEDEVIHLLELRKTQRDEEEKNRQLEKQLEQARQALKLSEAELEELRGDPVRLQALLRKCSIDPDSLPMLRELAAYRQGALSPGQLDELVNTHQLVLDPSVLRSQAGREFIEKQLVPRLQEANRAGRDLYMVMETTARDHLYQERAACKEADEAYRNTNWNSSPNREAERQELERRRQELQPAKSAYYFAQDILQERLLRYKGGTPSPHRSDEEMLRLFLEENSSQRMCVLTCGPTALAESLDHEQLPLCAVARVHGSHYFPAERRLGPACLIFPQYLPLAKGSGPVDYLAHLRESLRLDGKDYTAGAFQRGGRAPVPAAAPASIFRSDADRKKQPAFPPVSRLRQVEDDPLPWCGQVEKGTRLFTEEDRPVTITGRKLKEGGEGALYPVDLPGQVAKLYHIERLTSGRRQKLEDMIAHNPHIARLCWPTHLLYNEEGEFAGFLMPRTPELALTFQESVLHLGKPAVQEHVLPGWDRRDLVQSAKAVAEMAAELHENHILIGDINDGNFMVDPADSSHVYLVDCDSYQFDGYPCPVGTLDYTHPNTAARLGVTGELGFDKFLRTEEEEDYVLGILIFRILMLGQYPFVTTSGVSPVQAMREKRFPTTRGEAGDFWLIRKNIPKNLEKAFVGTFTNWEEGAPTAREWAGLLKDYLGYIDDLGFSRELMPQKYNNYGRKDDFYVNVHCEYDKEGTEFNIPKKNYERIEQAIEHQVPNRELFLCPVCKSFFDYQKTTKKLVSEHPLEMTCQQCGRRFPDPQVPEDAVVFDDWVHRYKVLKKITCPVCLEKIPQRRAMFRCEVCKKEYSDSVEWHDKYQKLGYPNVCRECKKLNTFTLTCCACRKEFSVTAGWKGLFMWYEPGKGFYCNEDRGRLYQNK